jgi:hypothetical protein
LEVSLLPFDIDKLKPHRVLRGRVIDPEGKSVAGAIVIPKTFHTNEIHGFKPGVVDPIAVTNLEGHFALTSRQPLYEVEVLVKARGLAPKYFSRLEPSQGPPTLPMVVGAEVVGRVILDGRPLADAFVGLVQIDRGKGFLGKFDGGTDKDGQFHFFNVGPNDTYYVYGLMSSLKERGAVSIKKYVSVLIGQGQM